MVEHIEAMAEKEPELSNRPESDTSVKGNEMSIEAPPAPPAPSSAKLPPAAPQPGPTPAPAPALATEPAPTVNMAQRLRDTGKTATYLSSGTSQKPPTPSTLSAVKTPSIRRTSGAQILPRTATPAVVSAVQPPAPVVHARRSTDRELLTPTTFVHPGASGRLKVPALDATAHHASPNASGSRQVSQAKWHCECCEISVDKEGVVNGTCKLVGGKLYCLKCFKKRVASRNLRLSLWAMGGVLLAGLAASAVFLTQPLLILLIPIGVLAVLTGIVGGGLDGSVRLGFVAAGLAAIVGSFWGTGVVSEHSESRQAQLALDKQAAQVTEQIQSSNFAQADARIEALTAQSKDRAGRYLSPEQQKKVESLRAQFDAQLRAKYGELTPHENHVLMTLIRAFPDDSANGSERFRAVHMMDTKVSLTVEKSRETPSEKDVAIGPMGDPATLQARTLTLFLFDSYPFLKEVEIETLGEKTQHVSYSREQITQLRMGGMMAPAELPQH